MSRLPIPGSDDGTWGDILNEYLSVEHNSDGTQKTVPLTKGGTGATDATTARTNLGLGNSATKDTGTAAGTVAAGDDSRITGAVQTSLNLSDLASATTARTNLGLGTAATADAADFDATGTAASAVSAHNADTTSVHGIADTSTLITSSDAATESVAGVVELATTAEVEAGTDTTRAVTPAGVSAAVAASGIASTSTSSGGSAFALMGWIYGSTVSYWNLVADAWHYQPVVAEGAYSVSTLMCSVQTAASAGTKAIMAIYAADATWQPGALIAQTAEFAIDSTGNKSVAITASLSAGRYLLGILPDQVINIYVRGGSGPIGPRETHGFISTDGFAVVRRGASTYSATAPSTGVAWTTHAANSYDIGFIMPIVSAA